MFRRMFLGLLLVCCSAAVAQPPVELADMEAAKGAALEMAAHAKVTEDTTCALAADCWERIQLIVDPVARWVAHERLQLLWMRYEAEGNPAFNVGMDNRVAALGYYDYGDIPAAIGLANTAKTWFEDALQIWIEVVLHNDAIEPQLVELLNDLNAYLGM